MIGTLNRKVIVSYPAYVQDNAGGIAIDSMTTWEQMASVETNSGNRGNTESYEQWTYDAKFVMRKINVIKSNYVIQYGGDKYAINSVKVTNERKKQYYEITATKVDGNI